MDNDNEHINDNIWHAEFLPLFSTIATKLTNFSSLSMLEYVCVYFNNDNNTKYHSKMKYHWKIEIHLFGFKIFHPINYWYILR
jgi:hypothetical protein